MKYLLLIIFLVLIGCKDRGGIEVIPDYDEIYLPPAKVDVPVEILGDDDKHLEKIQEIIGNHFIPQNDAFYFFRSKLYIDESGELNKIQFSKVEPNKNYQNSDINPRIEKLFPKLTEYLEHLEFSSALLGDKKVKSQFIWEASFRTNSKGEAEFYLGSLKLSGLKKLNNFKSEDFAEKVDEMPFPVGGMKALAMNVRYPQEAKKAGIEGRVFVKAYIDENGDVIWTDMIKGIGGGCELATINAVEKTKFVPGKQNGKPVKVQVVIPILFKLQ